jgi:hypothetical protein
VNAIPLPLTEVVRGLHEADFHNRVGHDSFLLGEFRKTGWWYFFPVVLAVKTPVGLLALLALALYRGRDLRSSYAGKVPVLLLTALFAVAMLAVCLTTHINLGVRHILPIYVPLAVLGGNVIATAASKWRVVALALAGIAATESALAHPDYLAAFNVFAGSHPERILAESDLDWGQDLHRLSVRLKELGVQQVTVDYFGSDWIHKAGLPPYRFADPRQPATGYVALSIRRFTLDNAKDGSYEWIKGREPLERIGKSIDLFYLTE